MNLSKQTWFELFGVVLITLVLYWPSFQFDFVNYDDQVYVINNSFISSPNISNLLDGSGTGNFHPMTMISLWLDNELGSGESSIFHIGNVIWHILNSVLVFFFVGRIFPDRKGVPFFVAILFAIHPMHIESVAWISSRKDLVYTFFYLTALIAYFDFLKTNKTKYLIITIGVGIISLLSKPAAITLPVALVLLQFLEFGQIKIKEILPLVPLFIGSIIIGLLTIQLQSNDAINDLETYSIIERLGFAFYGLFFYTLQSIFPVGLTAMHPYPTADDMLSWKFLISMFTGIALILIAVLGMRKDKKIGFGILFYMLNLVLMLQLVSIGRAIVAERYSYLSYLGLFIVIVVLLESIPLIQKKKSSFYILSLILGSLLFMTSIKQIKVWKNSKLLWTKSIEENPQDWYGYIGRGNYYRDISQNSKALSDFKMAIQQAPEQVDNYFNLGDLQRQMGDVQSAIATYSTAIQLRPDYEQAYINRGQFYIAINDGAKALADFNKAIELNTNSFLGYNNRGNLYLLTGNSEQAILDFSKAIELKPDYAKAWYNRGTAVLNSDLENAKNDLEQAIAIDPNYIDAYNNLGSVYYQTKDYDFAIEVYDQALQIDRHLANTWLNLSVVKNIVGDYSGALESALQAKKEGAQVSESYLNQLRSNIN